MTHMYHLEEVFNSLKFKKPLPVLEDRRQYLRICRRCEKEYRTFIKGSKICDNCKKNGQCNGVPVFLNEKSYKT